MRFFRSVLITILAAAILAPGLAAAGDAAWIDPLLSLLADHQAKAAGQPFDLALEQILAVDATGNEADPRIAVILRLENGRPDLSGVPGLTVGSVAGSIATARLPLSSLTALASVDGIDRIEAARRYRATMDDAVPAGRVDDVWSGAPAYTGAGVLVGIIDSGIDWTHEDFENADGTTRIQAIWDLNGTGTPPAGFTSGAEYTAAHIYAGLVSQFDYSGHGTHVTGIATGNGRASNGTYRGVAYESDILVAKAFDDEVGGFTGDQVIDAINYLVDKAGVLDQPIAINLSLGGHSGPHDGTSGQEALIDNLSGEGVVFVVAAGNEGAAQIHDSAPAASGSIDFDIDAYTPGAGVQDDAVVLEVWVETATGVSITTPGGTTYGPVASGASAASFDSDDGAIILDNASSGADPHNGDQLVYLQIDDQGGNVPAEGRWTIGFNGGSGTAHAWNVYSTMPARFPDSDDTYSVGIPGTAEAAVTVAAFTTKTTWVSQAGTGRGARCPARFLLDGPDARRARETRSLGPGAGHRFVLLQRHGPRAGRRVPHTGRRLCHLAGYEHVQPVCLRRGGPAAGKEPGADGAGDQGRPDRLGHDRRLHRRGLERGLRQRQDRRRGRDRSRRRRSERSERRSGSGRHDDGAGRHPAGEPHPGRRDLSAFARGGGQRERQR